MIHDMLPRTARRSRARRASRILLALTAMAALIGVDLPDAASGPPLGITAWARPGAEADRVGALFAGGLDGGHFCTAAVVRSDDRDVIATAAHCVEKTDTTVFAPGYRDGSAPYGLWKITGVFVAPGWTAGQDPDADIAFATVAPVDGGQTRRVEDLVGGFPVAAEQPAGARVTVIGYPRTMEARCAAPTAPACSPRPSAGSAAPISAAAPAAAPGWWTVPWPGCSGATRAEEPYRRSRTAR